MTNREKYKEEILDLLRTNNCAKLETFYNTYVATQYSISDYDGISWFEIIFAITLWLGEEYEEPKVDWSKVEIDTPVLVKQSRDNDWAKRYTAKKATEIWNRRKLIDKIVEQLENLEKRNRELEDAIERDGNEIVELANENRRLRMTLEIVKGGRGG